MHITRLMSYIRSMDCSEQSMPIAVAQVVCPKPRRSYTNSPSKRSCRFHINSDANSRSCGEFISKIEFKTEGTTQSSSPPFLYGSPPCRALNPLTRDAHFGDEKVTSILKSASESCLLELTHSREQSGKKQASVKVEGFDCPSSRVFAIS